MKKHKIIEIALIALAIILILASFLLTKNPTIVGYATQVEYNEYDKTINLGENPKCLFDNQYIIEIDLNQESLTQS